MHEQQTHAPTVPTSPRDQQWLTVAQAAAELGIDDKMVIRMLREGALLAASRDGQRQIPAAFIHEGATSRYLQGIITLLRDGGFSDDEALDWLLREDESLGASPAVAMHHNLHREVSRRAQALAF